MAKTKKTCKITVKPFKFSFTDPDSKAGFKGIYSILPQFSAGIERGNKPSHT